MCCSVLPPEIVMHDAYIGWSLRLTKITRKASDAAENLQLYRVVRFFHPRSSCMTHISADFQRITLNASSCITISGGRTEQLDIIAGFLPRHWLYERFSQFLSCGTYSVLSRSHSFIFKAIWLGSPNFAVDQLFKESQSSLTSPQTSLTAAKFTLFWHSCTLLPSLSPRAGSGVVRIDPLHFLAGCRTRRLNQV